MTIPLDAAYDVLDRKRTALLDEKHEVQQDIAAAEQTVRTINIEVASLTTAMNVLDNHGNQPIAKDAVLRYPKDDS